MEKLKLFLKKGFTAVTIMVVPHSKAKPVKIRVSVIGILSCFLLAVVGAAYIVSIGVSTLEYYGMRKKLAYFSDQFRELKTTMTSLKKADAEFARLLSHKSKKTILEEADTGNAGSIDVELLKKQVEETIQSVTEIRQYIGEQKNIYRATPMGWPVKGVVSSGFGMREHPVSGVQTRHTGIDIRAPMGTSVRATADGIVSFSNWYHDNGNVVVIEHGQGLTSVYAHNKQNYVKVGQKIARGELIAASGSTGNATGPHLHYEVWKNGRHLNPATFLKDIL
jgi:murein DD-endopeptidase MepM/ murein hydrolase activator NlpD